MTDIIHGRFEVVRSLGMGGMGLVVEARDRHDGRHVALKMLRPTELLQAHPIERFRREAQTMANLSHPHIVEMYGFLEDPPVMVLELLHGENVRAALKRESTFPLARACQIGMQIASALEAAHLSGAVHRDVKPSNIFLVHTQGRPHAKLLDFGVAKITDSDAPPLTRTNASVGSALYMSPEQVRGEAVHERSDTYALGLCLYEMLTGHSPYAGSNVHQAMVRMLGGEPLPENASVPTGLYAVLQRATSLAPERRYQAAGDLARALAPFAHTETPRTQLSVAIVDPARSVAPDSQTRPSSSSRQPTALMASNRPHFEAPSPASMTAPLTTLSEQRALGLMQAAAQAPLPPMPQTPMPQAPMPMAAPRRHAHLATTTRSSGPLAPLPPLPPRPATRSSLPWIAGACLLLSGGVGAALLWTFRSDPAPMPLAEAVVVLDAATLDAGALAEPAASVLPLASVRGSGQAQAPTKAKGAAKPLPAPANDGRGLEIPSER